MKPLPDLCDNAAMLKRGRMSALVSARKDAIDALRDAHTGMQSDDWARWGHFAALAAIAAERLIKLEHMWAGEKRAS